MRDVATVSYSNLSNRSSELCSSCSELEASFVILSPEHPPHSIFHCQAGKASTVTNMSTTCSDGSPRPLKKRIKMELDFQARTSPEVPTVDSMAGGTTAAAASAALLAMSGSSAVLSGPQGHSVSSSSTSSNVSSFKPAPCASTNAPNQTEAASSMDDGDGSLPGKVNPPHSDSETSSPRLAPTMGTGVHHGGGRIRLPDKLMEYLDKEVLPNTLRWLPGGESFVFDTEKIQSTFLDKHFRATKLKSFIRSLNRW
jgi:HSF-type DNA-binding